MTKEKILESAKREFLKRGFDGSNLRLICKNAGVTTGAFYRHFSSKEELFDCLVEKPLEDYYGMYYGLMKMRKDYADSPIIENELEAITYILNHKELFRLLFDCSKGTKYENFKSNLIDIFYQTYQDAFNHISSKPIDTELVKLIVEMKFQEYMTIIYSNYSMDKTKQLVTDLAIFTEAGCRAMVKEIENRLD